MRNVLIRLPPNYYHPQGRRGPTVPAGRGVGRGHKLEALQKEPGPGLASQAFQPELHADIHNPLSQYIPVGRDPGPASQAFRPVVGVGRSHPVMCLCIHRLLVCLLVVCFILCVRVFSFYCARPSLHCSLHY